MKSLVSRLTAEHLAALGLFGLLVITYTYVFPRWADPNQDSRLKMVIAVVEDGTFQIDKYLGTTVDYAKVNGHYYSDKAPGVAFVGVPVYAALRQLPLVEMLTARLETHPAFQETLRESGTGVNPYKVRFAMAQIAIAFVVGVLPTAAMCALMYLWLARVCPSPSGRMLIVVSYALLTPAYAYANTMYGHQLSAALLFGAFFWISTTQTRFRVPALLAIGVLLSYAVVTEYPVMLMTGILYLYAAFRLYRLRQWHGILWLSLAAAVVAVGWMFYNATVFGGPLNLGYSYSEQWVTQHQTGFMSLTLPHPDALWGITFSEFRGLFFLAPWLLLALPGFWFWWKEQADQRVELVVVLLCVLSITLFNSSSVMWWGGFAVGPRYLLPSLPMMVLATAFAFRRWAAHLWFKGLAAISLAWSLVAVWGLTLAEQAFPPDTIQNPLVAHALPNWLVGNIARNVGTLIGLRGIWSILPMLLLVGVLLLCGWWFSRRQAGDVQIKHNPFVEWTTSR